MAHPRVMARVERLARDRARACARPEVTPVDLRADVAIIARRSVGLWRMAAAQNRIALAAAVTIIDRRAHSRVRSRAEPGMALVRLGAYIAIVARRPISLGYTLARLA